MLVDAILQGAQDRHLARLLLDVDRANTKAGGLEWDISWTEIQRIAGEADKSAKYMGDGTIYPNSKKKMFVRNRGQDGRFIRQLTCEGEEESEWEETQEMSSEPEITANWDTSYTDQIMDSYENLDVAIRRVVHSSGSRDSPIGKSAKKLARTLRNGEATSLTVEDMIDQGRIASVLCRERDDPKHAKQIEGSACPFFMCNPNGCQPRRGRTCTMEHVNRKETLCNHDANGRTCPRGATCKHSHKGGIYSLFVKVRGKERQKPQLKKYDIYDRVTPSSPFAQ
jgi:hypothetical protein